MTTDAGRPVGDNQNSLTVGARGPVVFEDALHQAEEVAGLAVIIPYSPVLQPHTHSAAKEKTMRQRKVIRTTLGELIVAISDEVAPIIRNPSAMHILVSVVLTDLLAHHQVRVHKRSRQKLKSFR